MQNDGERKKEPGKRGVKADKNYLKNAVKNLKKLYINYTLYPHMKKSDEDFCQKEMDKRTRKRNEISALESRIKKKIEEVNTQAELLQLKERLSCFIDAICSNVDETKAKVIFEKQGFKQKIQQQKYTDSLRE